MAPFMSALAASVRKRETGQAIPFSLSQLLRDLLRGVRTAATLLLAELSLTLLLARRPVVDRLCRAAGGAAVPLLLLIGWAVGAYFYGAAIFDAVHEQAGHDWRSSIRVDGPTDTDSRASAPSFCPDRRPVRGPVLRHVSRPHAVRGAARLTLASLHERPFIAIGGAAMHNLALALHHQGHTVTGSDDAIRPEPGPTGGSGTSPRHHGVAPRAHPPGLDTVILGIRHGGQSELARARELELQVVSYRNTSSMLRRTNGVVVAGSHGKTSITAMLPTSCTSSDEPQISWWAPS